MKKYMIYSIAAILLLTLVVASSTYAFFVTSAQTSNNSISSKTTTLDIIYDSGESIDNNINIVSRKEEGYNTTVNIRTAPNSANAKTNLYIYIEELTENIAIEGFVWEVYGYKNNTQVYSNQGNFEGYNDTDNKIVPIVTNYMLSEDNTSFTVYFWLDGSKTDNSVVGGSFKGYIGASSEEFSATLH